jgi:hypothetical protein
MIVVVATLPLFLALVCPVFMLFNREIPRSTQLVIEQGTVLEVLDQIRQDVDQAKALPRSYGQWSTDEQTLLIDKAGCVVLYRVAEGKVTRAMVGPGGGPPEPAGEWALPNASIRWVLWGQGTNAYAVEVHSHMIYKLRTRDQGRLANTHMFFLLGSPKEVTS